MFLVDQDLSASVRCINKMRSALSSFDCGSVQVINMGNTWLTWFGYKPSDNLHVYNDGYIIGKLSFAETCEKNPIIHNERMPGLIHSLLNCVKIRKSKGEVVVEPNNITNVFYQESTVSDSQLLIADLKNLLPSSEGVAILSTVGYLPGNLSIFHRVRKIPFLESYNLSSQKLLKAGQLAYRKNNDAEMINRLTHIVPKGITRICCILKEAKMRSLRGSPRSWDFH
jgi:hypothetical protein